MDRPQFDALLQTIGHSRRAVMASLLAISGEVLGEAITGAGKKGKRKRRRRRITLCYQGETIKVKPARKRRYPGATSGACTCTTCEAAGKTCGPIADVCGGTTSCGVCEVGPQNSCNNGTCDTCTAVCDEQCPSCASLVDGSTVCTNDSITNCMFPCMTDADCPVAYPTCVSTEAYRKDNQSRSWPADCGVSTAGICTIIIPC